jgi:hypothetical protein
MKFKSKFDATKGLDGGHMAVIRPALRRPCCLQEGRMPIKTSGLSADAATQAYLKERISFKFGKFARHVKDMVIRLKPEIGPNGEPLVGCSLSIVLDCGGSLIVKRNATRAREAFDHAVGVAERSLRNKIQKQSHLQV